MLFILKDNQNKNTHVNISIFYVYMFIDVYIIYKIKSGEKGFFEYDKKVL